MQQIKLASPLYIVREQCEKDLFSVNWRLIKQSDVNILRLAVYRKKNYLMKMIWLMKETVILILR